MVREDILFFSASGINQNFVIVLPVFCHISIVDIEKCKTKRTQRQRFTNGLSPVSIKEVAQPPHLRSRRSTPCVFIIWLFFGVVNDFFIIKDYYEITYTFGCLKVENDLK